MSKNVSRRAMLAGIAATVPAAPAVVALTVNPESPDADLLALGVQLDRIAEEVHAQRTIDQASQDAFELKVEKITGIARRDVPAIDENDPSGYWEIRKAIAQDGTGIPDEDNPWNPIHDRLFPLAEDILSRKAQTIAGLAVQTRAVVLAAADVWEQETPEAIHERTFIEAVCRFVGVPIPAIQSPHDPIFAAIDAHRTALAALEADTSRLDEEDTPEALAKLDELHDAVSEAEERLIETKPSTMAGAKELSQYAAECEARDDGWTDARGIHRNIANAIETVRA